MATAAIWSKKRNGVMTSNSGIRSAPCTIFSTTTLSPRQIANKAYTLGCKKLDRDEKRSKQKYHVRERLLINNTISKAEEVLNTRTRRTNRRVMAAEDEDEDSSDEFSIKKSNNQPHHHVSPLKNMNSDDEEEEDNNIPNNASTHTNQSESNLHHLLHRDCRINSDSKIIASSPITTTNIY